MPLIDLHDPDGIVARRPLLIAHRGGVVTEVSPENSGAAIRLAAADGYDLVELASGYAAMASRCSFTASRDE